MIYYLQREPINFPKQKGDPHFPKQTAEELSVRNHVVEISFFSTCWPQKTAVQGNF